MQRSRPLPGNWNTTRLRILKRDKYRCTCGARATDVDHIVPAWLNGSEADANLRSLCASCHKKKTDQESVEAREHYRRLNRRSDKMPWQK